MASKYQVYQSLSLRSQQKPSPSPSHLQRRSIVLRKERERLDVANPPAKRASMMDNIMRSSEMRNQPATPPRAFIQPKLKIGAVGDKYEQEADRMAKEVVNRINAPQPSELPHPGGIQQKAIPIRDRQRVEDSETIQRKISAFQQIWRKDMQANTAGETVTREFEQDLGNAQRGGQPLEPKVKSQMEEGFGADFSEVKVHADRQSDRLNQSIQAKAFTTGTNIFFKQGEYNPNSRGGQELLAHELTHVVQQIARQGQENSTIQRRLDKNKPISADDIHAIENPHGLVFILEGREQEKLVVKFEIPGRGESVEQYQARYTIGNEMVGQLFNNAIGVMPMTEKDKTALLEYCQRWETYKGDGEQVKVRRGLQKNINKGLFAETYGVKMDYQQLGEDLFKMARSHKKGEEDYSQELLSAYSIDKMETYGKMAYYDVLTRNSDRFNSDGGIMNNLDYDATYENVVPLDNVCDLRKLLTGRAFDEDLNEMRNIGPGQRDDYALRCLSDIADAAGAQKNGPDYSDRVRFFKRGMDLAEFELKRYYQRMKGIVKFQARGFSKELLDTYEVLIARYEVGQGMQ